MDAQEFEPVPQRYHLKTVIKSVECAETFYSEENIIHLENAIMQLRKGKGTVHELIEDDSDHKLSSKQN